jgi:GMP synthase-like glutamine amidotransferase
MREIVIVDYGSQFSQLIARRVREHHVFCRIVTPKATATDVASPNLAGVILSGGPASVYEPGLRPSTRRSSISACPSSGSATGCSCSPI